jgi:hypothetical protein
MHRGRTLPGISGLHRETIFPYCIYIYKQIKTIDKRQEREGKMPMLKIRPSINYLFEDDQ